MNDLIVSPIQAIAIANGHMKPPSREGAGTELKALLKKIGIVPSSNCACNSRAQIMNNMGVAWCEDNIETIVGWLSEEAGRRGMPFVRPAGVFLIRSAIRRAKRHLGV